MSNLISKLVNGKEEPKYIRNERYLGNRKIIVGDLLADLVLETLGKVYIKSGRNNMLINDLFKLLDEKLKTSDVDDIAKSIILISSTDELKNMEHPGDGKFIYDTLNKILYISIFNLYVALVNARLDVENTYVKKSGDTMSGQLEIKTPHPPLIVHSRSIVNNLNSEMVDGYTSKELAKIYKNEYIVGDWTFGGKCEALNNWKFYNNVSMMSDLISYGSLSSSKFASGFGGYGWRLDGSTNTLTIDNLVVRKLMMVYEMVINKISATNGSLWVSNSCKCESANKLTFIDDINQTIKLSIILMDGEDNVLVTSISGISDGYYVFTLVTGNNISTYVSGDHLSNNQYFGNATSFREFTYVYRISKIEAFENSLISYLNARIDEAFPEEIEVTSELQQYAQEQMRNVLTDNVNLLEVLKGIESILTRNDNHKTNDFIQLDASFQALTLSLLDPVDIKIYYKYFGAPIQDGEFINNYWIVNTDKEEYSLFKVGDILRCLKMLDSGSIKYYDALVVQLLADRTFLVLKALSVLDIYSEVSYDEEGNVVIHNSYNDTQYSRGEEDYLRDGEGNVVYDEYGNPVIDPAKRIADIQEKDDLIQVGNIQNVDRQGSIYLTSSDDMSPYIEVMSKVNRPDYSVSYRMPKWIMYKSYYVSTYPSDIRLGKFKVNKHTNTILGRLIDQDSWYEDLPHSELIKLSWEPMVLYGFTAPSSKCLVLKAVVTDAGGNPVVNDNGEYTYKQIEGYSTTTSARLGKLDGAYDPIFGSNLPNGYGLYANNVFLTGEFYLNNGKSIASFADDITLLSGKIEGIDIDQLKIDVAASVENIIENKFKSTTDDEEGNEIPAGFAGLFTFDYTDSTVDSIGGGALDGKKGLAVLGDSIVFYTSKDGKFDFDKPTALIRDEKINAELIDVKELEFDKLVGMCQYDPVIIESIQFHDKSDLDNIILGTIIGTAEVIPIVVGKFTQGNYIKKGTLYLEDFYIKVKGGIVYNVKHPIEDFNNAWTYTEIEDPLSKLIYPIPNIGEDINTKSPWNDVQLALQNKNTYASISYEQKSKEYDIISVNKNKFGETILYYPDGSVLNAKIVSQSEDKSSVIGCVEYWFQQGSITPKDLLDGGDSYVVSNYMYGDPSLENYTNGLIKRINYFSFVDKFEISWRTVLTDADSIEEWNTLLSKLYTTLKEVFNYFNDLHKEASSGNGKLGSSYSLQIAKILKNFKKTPTISSTVGIGTGSGIITWADGTETNPVDMWFKYALNLSDTINTYIEETDKTNNTIAKKLNLISSLTINEGLHILNYSYTNENTGRFDIEYFNYDESIIERIRFTINNGEYNGVIFAPTNQIM